MQPDWLIIHLFTSLDNTKANQQHYSAAAGEISMGDGGMTAEMVAPHVY